MIKKKSLESFYRKIVQFLSIAFFIYVVWKTKYPLNKFLNPKVFFEIDPLIMIITKIASRIFLITIFFSFLTLGLTFIFGRYFCGWICPLGTVLDLWRYLILKTKKFFNKKVLNEDVDFTKNVRKVKYYILLVLIFLSLLGVQLVWIFDPITIFFRTLYFNIHPFLNNLIEKIFYFLLNRVDNLQIQSFYYWMRANFLGINNIQFAHSSVIFYFFCVVLFLSILKSRFWCRYLCPLGAMFAFVAKKSLLERKVLECVGKCSYCAKLCRMGAIKEDNSYIKEECILCMDCVSYCVTNKTKFTFSKSQQNEFLKQKNFYNNSTNLFSISRKEFLISLITSTFFLLNFRKRRRSNSFVLNKIIRPPGAAKEKQFVQLCVRCGNCMKICPTNVLQPCLLESGIEGIWTPRLNNKIGYCEYNCNLCGKVCPTQAIKNLKVEEKVLTKIGTANINKNLCIPWRYGKNCLVCEEHCPVPTKAIKVVQRKIVDGKVVKLPEVLSEMCIGCGICENKCPAFPQKAIQVLPLVQ